MRLHLAELAFGHRLRVRCYDRIRCTKDTGLASFPPQDFTQNRIWSLLVVALACDIPAFPP